MIFINNGTVKLEVESVDAPNIQLRCEVKTAGKISDNKGCNMPSGNLSVEVVTKKDEADLEFIAKNLVPEYVAASFIGNGEDVRKVRAALSRAGNDNIKIIAKLERPAALENLEEIVRESDAVMVARGDLGVEIEAWDVPSWQKKAVALANRLSTPVIVATQMLESMTDNARLTRAEASDVFNAVVDGADAVMLSGESSVGKYPVESVRVMDNIVSKAQEHIPRRDPEAFHSDGDAIAEDACMAVHAFTNRFEGAAHKKNAKVIVLTRNGFAARALAKYRPDVPILAFSENLRTVRELALCWRVKARHLPLDAAHANVEERAMDAIAAAKVEGLIEASDERVVVLCPGSQGPASYYCGIFSLDKPEALQEEQKKVREAILGGNM